ncbi:MAG: type IV toxin-antitoxin system AbiEi family antitoxin domain-containing protein [Acidobacteriota bacterium]
MTLFRSSQSREEIAKVLQQTDGWITVADAASALGIDRRTAAKRLARWTTQGWLKRIQRGHYVPIPLERSSAEAPLEDPWLVVPHLIPRGYVGGWTAAHHWDLTEQLFRDVCVLGTRRHRRILRAGITYVIFSATGPVFGVRTHWVGATRIPISDPTRTLVDMLSRPEAGPGIQHLADCLTNFVGARDSRIEDLLRYAERLGNGAVFKRLGYLLERRGITEGETLERCRRNLTRGLTHLDPAMPCPRVVSRWRLRVPDDWARPIHD